MNHPPPGECRLGRDIHGPLPRHPSFVNLVAVTFSSPGTRMQGVSFPFQPPLRLRQIGVVLADGARRSALPRPPAAVEQV